MKGQKNVAHLHNVVLTVKHNDIIKLSAKWMKLQKKLSLVGNSDPERQTWHNLTHTWPLTVKLEITIFCRP